MTVVATSSPLSPTGLGNPANTHNASETLSKLSPVDVGLSNTVNRGSVNSATPSGRIPADGTLVAAAGVDDVIFLGLIGLVGVAFLAASYKAYKDLESDPGVQDLVRRKQAYISQEASKLHDAFVNRSKTLGGFLSDKIPSVESIKNKLTEIFQEADRSGKSIQAVINGMWSQLRGGQSSPAPSKTIPTVPTPNRINTAPSANRTSPQPTQQPNTTRSSNPQVQPVVPLATRSDRRPVNKVSPLPTVVPQRAQDKPDPAIAAARAQDVKDRAAVELLTRSDAITPRMNAGVLAFYNKAAGGQAARRLGDLREPIGQVAQARSELNELIKQANGKIAASSVNHQKLDAWRDNLVRARKEIDVWLPQARKFAAGQDANGKATPTPTLPKPPDFVSSPANSKRTALEIANDLKAAYWSAANVSNKGVAQPGRVAAMPAPSQVVGTSNTQAVSAGQIKLVSEMPDSVTHVAKVWVNPTTGKGSATPQRGEGWLEVTLGRPLQMNGSGLDGLSTEPGAIVLWKKQPNKDPNNKTNNLIILSIVVTILSTIGVSWSQRQDQERAAADGEWKPNTVFERFSTPKARDLPTHQDKADAIFAMWKNYTDQFPATVKRSGMQGQSAEKSFQVAASDFLENLELARQNVANAPTPDEKKEKLAIMFDMTFPAVNPVDATDTSPHNVRRGRAYAVLIDAMNTQSRNKRLGIMGITIKSPESSPSATTDRTKPGTGKTPVPTNTGTGKSVADQWMDRHLPMQSPGSTVTLKQPQRGQANPSPAASAVPSKQTATNPSPSTRPVVPSTSTSAVTPKAPDPVTPQAKTAFAKINKLQLPGGLQANPSAVTPFKMDAFVNPAQQNDLEAIKRGERAAIALFNRVTAIHTESDKAVQRLIVVQVMRPLAAVQAQLSARITELEKKQVQDRNTETIRRNSEPLTPSRTPERVPPTSPVKTSPAVPSGQPTTPVETTDPTTVPSELPINPVETPIPTTP